MKKYQSHKIVEAAKIVTCMPGIATLTVKDTDDGLPYMLPLKFEYFTKHQPTPGGYYVRYADGYESFSPAAAFEEGYKEVTE